MTAAAIDQEKLTGSWVLVDWVQEYDDGRVLRPFGEGAQGFITYVEGRMSAFITRGDREPFTTGGQWNADAAEKARAYDETLAYVGRFTLSGDLITHHVEGALFPNWVGHDQVRRVAYDGTNLDLLARLEEGSSEARTARLRWVRWTPDSRS